MRKAAFAPRIEALLGGCDQSAAASAVSSEIVADLVGVSRRRIEQLAGEGVVPRIAPGRYDQREVVRAYCEFLRAGASGRGTADKGYRDERTRLAKVQADKIAQQNAVSSGELVAVSDVAAAWSSILADVRAAMLAIPSRVQGIDRHAVETLDREIREALEGLADAG